MYIIVMKDPQKCMTCIQNTTLRSNSSSAIQVTTKYIVNIFFAVKS